MNKMPECKYTLSDQLFFWATIRADDAVTNGVCVSTLTDENRQTHKATLEGDCIFQLNNTEAPAYLDPFPNRANQESFPVVCQRVTQKP